MKTNRFLFAAGVMLALVFAFGCSSDDGNGNSADGGGNSSVTGGADGGGNQDPQVYINEDGRPPFTSSGIIEVTTDDVRCYSNDYCEYDDEIGDMKCYKYDYCDTWNGLRVGSVTNGIVKLELPENVPSEFLKDFSIGGNNCSYPKDIKTTGATTSFILTNNEEYLGDLSLHNLDRPITENVYYAYFTKAAKINCSFNLSDGTLFVLNVDVKEGWNKLHRHRESGRQEYNTNNILSKEVKWLLDMNE